jgi:hypothetical protein
VNKVNKKKIFWVDDDSGVARPDIVYLEYRGYEVLRETSASSGLDWFVSNRHVLEEFAAFVIDIQLPTNGDKRFSHVSGIVENQGLLAGLRICQILKSEMLDPGQWKYVQQKMLLFTRLPATMRIQEIQSFAKNESLLFIHKLPGENLHSQLAALGLVSDED